MSPYNLNKLNTPMYIVYYSSNLTSPEEETSVDELKSQLMIELEGFIKSQHGRLRQEMESEMQRERIALLRKPRGKHDELVKEAENEFENCLVGELVHRMDNENSTIPESCPWDWPLLPDYDRLNTCNERIRLLQNHCTKLGRCCSAVNECHDKVNNMTITDSVMKMKNILAVKSADCQIKNSKAQSTQLYEKLDMMISKLQIPSSFSKGDMILARRDDLCVYIQAKVVDVYASKHGVHYNIQYINYTEEHNEIVDEEEASRRFVVWTKANLARANALLLMRRAEQKFALVRNDLRRQLLLSRFADLMDDLASPLK
uniref:CXXC-type zinc finger protein 1 n=1 Tax=Steinernema glaseri TaxID=37863 RepID=A0A1I7ZY12_9BILA